MNNPADDLTATQKRELLALWEPYRSRPDLQFEDLNAPECWFPASEVRQRVASRLANLGYVLRDEDRHGRMVFRLSPQGMALARKIQHEVCPL